MNGGNSDVCDTSYIEIIDLKGPGFHLLFNSVYFSRTHFWSILFNVCCVARCHFWLTFGAKRDSQIDFGGIEK